MSAATQVAADAPVERSGTEFDFVVACCADTLDGGDRVRTIASSSLDWDRVLALAQRHRVTAQVYERLRRPTPCGVRNVGSDVGEKLRSHYQNNARKALSFTGELTRIVSHLESSGIE